MLDNKKWNNYKLLWFNNYCSFFIKLFFCTIWVGTKEQIWFCTKEQLFVILGIILNIIKIKIINKFKA